MSPQLPEPPTFYGTARQKIDEKGRICLPKRWEESVQSVGTFVLTPSPRGCLLLMREDRWQQFCGDIPDHPFDDQESGDCEKLFLFVGHRDTATPDKSLRILISQALRECVGIDERENDVLYLVGTGQEIQVWSKTRWMDAVTTACKVRLAGHLDQQGASPLAGKPAD